ncbi:thioredoxin family protein [Aquibium sp. LZ166]|uniref:Thioredoxin family protein n=1 Tax=Aquibium pacificus TaxID=3153579 RepID=A0ABV3SHG9_9HYPH
MGIFRKIGFLLAMIASPALPAAAQSVDGKPRAVVELFTSQGCSSCPPADAYFADLARRGDVVALAYHVDYWDYLGWGDTLADPENTARQRDYARALGQRSVYTPQVVVNGREHMNGANRDKIEGAVADMDAAGKGLVIDVSIRQTPESIIIDTGAGTHRKGKANVVLVFFEPATQVEIARGENAGKSISYWNAVSAIQSAGMWHGREMRLEIPSSELKKKGAGGCAVLLQAMGKDGAPGPIIGAAILDHPIM